MKDVIVFPVRLVEPALEPQCTACGFFLHSHHKYSQICPVMVKGMLSQFRATDATTGTQRAVEVEL